jgi:uncharacterized protein YjbI with pentapeptide repeats
MHALKPMKVGLLHKMFCVRSEYYFGVEALLYTDFRSGALGSEIGLWKMVAEELPGMTLDEAVPKSHGEFFVRGHAYAPGGTPSPTCPVKVVVGPVEKSLAVLGDRRWVKDVPTEPEPFVSMPITWDRAFGGDGFALNPIGRGFRPIVGEDGEPIHPLPNIEAAGRLISSPKARPDPIGLMPLDFSSPIRMKKAGTYDEQWAKERFPGYADDIDWTIFNAAPEDQWAPEFWAPDTEFELTHLHPTERKVAGRLPNYVGRAFAVFGKSAKAGQRWEEVPLNLVTLWFFPHLEKVVLGFTGAVKVTEDDGSDVDWVVVAAEHADRPKPMSHYQRVMADREGYEPEAVAARFRDSELLPEGIPADIEEIMVASEEVQLEQIMRINQVRGAIEDWEAGRARCAAAGVDPDEYLGPSPYTEADLETKPPMGVEEAISFAMAQRAVAEKQEADAKRQQTEVEAQFREMTAEAGMDMDAEMAKGHANLPVGAPIQWAKSTFQKYQDLVETLRSHGFPDEALEAQVADPKLLETLQELERMQIEAYRMTGHVEDDSRARVPDEAFLEGARAWLESELRGSKSFRGRDLTGADLSGLDLSGADFEGAFLEHANLEGATCHETNFQRAVLVRTNWRGATVGRASFEEANLGRADLSGLRIDAPTDFQRAIMDKAVLGPLSFTGCRLVGVEVADSDLTGADFAGLEAPDIIFRRCVLANATFAGANLANAEFDECTLSGVDFSGAALARASFHACKASRCTFVGARCAGLEVTLGSALDECDFSEADLTSAYLRGVSMLRSRFEAAILDHADLSRSPLEGACFDGARGRHVRLTGAHIEGATFVRADLMFAALDKAHAFGAKFDQANLFTADFGLIHSDAETSVAGANTKRVKIQPTRKPE